MNVRKLSTVEFRDKLSEVVNEAAYGGRPTIIERHGRGVAILMPLELAPDAYKVQGGIVSTVSCPTTIEPDAVTNETNLMDDGG